MREKESAESITTQKVEYQGFKGSIFIREFLDENKEYNCAIAYYLSNQQREIAGIGNDISEVQKRIVDTIKNIK